VQYHHEHCDQTVHETQLAQSALALEQLVTSAHPYNHEQVQVEFHQHEPVTLEAEVQAEQEY
jgi:hypothetical protein